MCGVLCCNTRSNPSHTHTHTSSCTPHTPQTKRKKFYAAAWFAWGLFFDPGTQTSLSGYSNSRRDLLAAGAISVLGFLFNLTVGLAYAFAGPRPPSPNNASTYTRHQMLGFIVDRMRTILDQTRLLYGRVVVNDHVLVCGWTDKTLFLLQELMTLLADEKRGWFNPPPTIVTLGTKHTT